MHIISTPEKQNLEVNKTDDYGSKNPKLKFSKLIPGRF